MLAAAPVSAVIYNVSKVTIPARPETEVAANVQQSTIPPQPQNATYYNDKEKQWYCGIGDSHSIACPNGMSDKEVKKLEDEDACVGRSGKEEHTLGWSWANSLCEKDPNAF